MRNKSKHRLNFFERLTDPMRFGHYTIPPERIIKFIWHYCAQIKLPLFAVFILKFVEVLLDLSVPLMFGYIINRIILDGDIELILRQDLKFLHQR